MVEFNLNISIYIISKVKFKELVKAQIVKLH